LTKKECEKKTARWQRIADEAAKQCGRGALIEVGGMLTFKEALDEASKAHLPLFCYEGESARSLKEASKDAPSPATVSVFIGSEGGFSVDEAEAASERGMISVGLGRRILRTETASSFVLACLSYEFEMK
ncbi:MAG: RNA methyltransferase, partial [Clostridia bacterium]|nr:RNA methyltransferase [Clostridia bacterium]